MTLCKANTKAARPTVACARALCTQQPHSGKFIFWRLQRENKRAATYHESRLRHLALQ